MSDRTLSEELRTCKYKHHDGIKFLEDDWADRAAALELELQYARETIKMMRVQRDDACHKVNALQAERDDLETECDRWQRDAAKWKAAYERECVEVRNGLMTTISEQAARAAALEAERNAFKRHNNNLADKMAALEAERDSYKARCAAMAGENGPNEQTWSYAQERARKLDARIHELEAERDNLQERVDFLESRVGEIPDSAVMKLAELTAERDKLAAEHEALLRQIHEVAADPNSRGAQNERLRQWVDQYAGKPDDIENGSGFHEGRRSAVYAMQAYAGIEPLIEVASTEKVKARQIRVGENERLRQAFDSIDKMFSEHWEKHRVNKADTKVGESLTYLRDAIKGNGDDE